MNSLSFPPAAVVGLEDNRRGYVGLARRMIGELHKGDENARAQPVEFLMAWPVDVPAGSLRNAGQQLQVQRL